MTSIIVVTVEAGVLYESFYYEYSSKLCIIVLTAKDMQGNCQWYSANEMKDHLV